MMLWSGRMAKYVAVAVAAQQDVSGMDALGSDPGKLAARLDMKDLLAFIIAPACTQQFSRCFAINIACIASKV